MKNKKLLALGIVVVLALIILAGCSAARVSPADVSPVKVSVNNQEGIWVNGEGKVTITPDIALLSLGVAAQTTSVAEAQSQASTAMDKVIAALTGAGVASKDIQTQYFNIQQVTRWDDATQQEITTGYRVSNMVTAKIRALDKVGSIIDDVVSAGGNFTRINGVSFSVEKPEQYYSQARELAIKDAKSKADNLASLAGVTLGKAVYVSESSNSPEPYRSVMYSGMPAPATVAAPVPYINPGETDVILNVQVNYSIQ